MDPNQLKKQLLTFKKHMDHNQLKKHLFLCLCDIAAFHISTIFSSQILLKTTILIVQTSMVLKWFWKLKVQSLSYVTGYSITNLL